ncbi:MAG: HflC protein [Candidatus Latescibacteria bacterium 4484_7]|nr:MAG: HflC protein [Candidatus Latescibacteria bacterium 4484_7]
MTGRRAFGIIVLLLFVIIVLNSSFYSLNEYEQAVITQFGRPIGDGVTKAGLHVKIPFIQKLHRFEKRILIWDGSADQIPTSDKKYIWLDTTARWRIKDPLVFYQSVGNVVGAQTRLDDIVDSAARDIVSSNLLIEVVRNSNRVVEELGRGGKREEEIVVTFENIKLGREKLTHEILKRASELTPQYGIELLDVQIKRLNYVEDVRKKVYERMISERQRIASKYRSEGEGKKAEIIGMKEKELNRIQSEAYKRAQEIKGEADGRATKIYADAYRLDPEFYSFLKTLEVYKNTIGKNSQVIITTDSDIYRYLKRIK